MNRLTLARAPLASHLDIIKFICKDLFLYVYSKQIDNLRTNHRVSTRLVLPLPRFKPVSSTYLNTGGCTLMNRASTYSNATPSHL
jgi:hypothetical protein